jgi:hypothetical protein
VKTAALINYDEAAALFAAAGLPASTRTVRRKVWANPDVCPVDTLNYHTKQLRRRDVLRLIHKLKGKKS